MIKSKLKHSLGWGCNFTPKPYQVTYSKYPDLVLQVLVYRYWKTCNGEICRTCAYGSQAGRDMNGQNDRGINTRAQLFKTNNVIS